MVQKNDEKSSEDHKPENNFGKIYDNADVLQLFKITSRTLANWRTKGIITYVKIGGKIFYPERDICQLIDRNKVKALFTIKKTER